MFGVFLKCPQMCVIHMEKDVSHRGEDLYCTNKLGFWVGLVLSAGSLWRSQPLFLKWERTERREASNYSEGQTSFPGRCSVYCLRERFPGLPAWCAWVSLNFSVLVTLAEGSLPMGILLLLPICLSGKLWVKVSVATPESSLPEGSTGDPHL